MMIDARYPEIDVLVNNAGMFGTRREETPEGHERVLATNHLSAFVLTRALIPALRAAAEARGSARIVNVGSSTSDRARIDPADLEGRRRWGMVRAYSQSKLALMMATFGWARRLEGTGVVANVVHPGAVATKLVRARGAVGLGLARDGALRADRGAGRRHPAARLPGAGVRHHDGAYVKRRRIVRPNRRALDPSLSERVWPPRRRWSADEPQRPRRHGRRPPARAVAPAQSWMLTPRARARTGRAPAPRRDGANSVGCSSRAASGSRVSWPSKPSRSISERDQPRREAGRERRTPRRCR